MATNVQTITRPLSAVTADLIHTRQRLRHLQERCIGREPTEAEDEIWDALDDRTRALERDFDVAFFDATGVSWQLAEGARS